ncbi:MAG TPA: hypothetical protein VHM89_03680 [Acidimicrobiales bacterium]|nr:hypothetical protein [Acidimicrobiales bacterium]
MLPGRDHLHARLHRLLAAGLVTVPAMRGDRAFYCRQDPDQEHPVVVVREADGTERVLVDPAALSEERECRPRRLRAVPRRGPAGYLLSEGGDEESSLRVLDVRTGEVVDGPVDRTGTRRWRGCPAVTSSSTSGG